MQITLKYFPPHTLEKYSDSNNFVGNHEQYHHLF